MSGMRWRLICRIIGTLVACIGLSMLWPLGFSLYYRDGSYWPLLQAMAVSLTAGAAMYLLGQAAPGPRPINHREGMAATTLGWLAAVLVGALPFYLAGTFTQPVDCILEAMSGFTTTGASALADVEAIPRGLLFWRSLTQWLGGMGIVVMALAILPFLGMGGMELYKAEVPGPVADKFKPRLRDTALILWKVYLVFTVLEAVLLMAGGMDFFDALCHTFSTLATGGFSTKNASIGFYHSVYLEGVVMIFMLIGGVNFALHVRLFRGKPLAVWRDPELRFFLGMTAVVALVITLSLWGKIYPSLGESFRYGVFQAVSLSTTTGYGTADFTRWPSLAQCLLLLCLFMGSMVGSTGGAIKSLRILVLLKQSFQELTRLVHPRAVVRVKLGREAVAPKVLSGIWAFFILYLGLFAVSTFLVAASGVDLVTSFSGVLACLGNVGRGLGKVGPAGSYATLPGFAKWVLILDMLLGRLEIFPVILLFVPGFYKK
jgi:trk system potassium uptake protein